MVHDTSNYSIHGMYSPTSITGGTEKKYQSPFWHDLFTNDASSIAAPKVVLRQRRVHVHLGGVN